MKGPWVGIVGHRGYSGAELVRILTRHRSLQPVLLEHRDDHNEPIAIRNGKSLPRFPCTPDAVRREGIELVFLATPPDV